MGKALIGARLRAVRIDSGQQAKDLAERLSWHPSKVTRIELGQQAPTLHDVSLWIGACAPADIEMVDDLMDLLHQPDNEDEAPSLPQPNLGILISDATLTRLVQWANYRGYTIEEAIIVLLGTAAANEP